MVHNIRGDGQLHSFIQQIISVASHEGAEEADLAHDLLAGGGGHEVGLEGQHLQLDVLHTPVQLEVLPHKEADVRIHLRHNKRRINICIERISVVDFCHELNFGTFLVDFDKGLLALKVEGGPHKHLTLRVLSERKLKVRNDGVDVVGGLGDGVVVPVEGDRRLQDRRQRVLREEHLHDVPVLPMQRHLHEIEHFGVWGGVGVESALDGDRHPVVSDHHSLLHQRHIDLQLV
mmetsp:Transcript_34217/g.33441  ORF Transcript_34217/g.33441 Transcript_34217/m.33441 type:complete len:232 (-) Transcript_34217:731-1426(-)